VHRVVEIAWLPRSGAEWATLTAARLAAGKLWADLVRRHARIRRLGGHLSGRYKFKWPSKSRWMTWVKRRYPSLSAQSAQQSVFEFLEAVNSTRQLHKRGHAEARYPWKTPRYGDVTYTNQGARIRNGFLLLPNGAAGTLRVKMPRGLALPGRLMEVRLAFGRVRLVCKLDDVAMTEPAVTIGVDLGVNTLIAAGDGEHAVLVSGREVKATVQWRAKRLAELSAAQSTKAKGSRRWCRMQRRKHRVLDKTRNRIRDITHKATRIVADAFPNAKAVVGKPFNDAAQKMGRKQAQQVSQACNRKIIALLAYKLAGGVTEVEEHYTSQTCPVCGERRRCRRIYRCDCGFSAPRDVVGLTNIRRIGIHGSMVLSADDVPRRVTFAAPHRKYPGETRPRRGSRSQVVPGEPRHVARGVA
jgi:putative transposase